MRKALLFSFVLLLAIGNPLLSAAGGLSSTFLNKKKMDIAGFFSKSVPLGDAEEKSEEDSSEEDDESFIFTFSGEAKILSINKDQHASYLRTQFKSPDRKVFTPPPQV